MLIRHALVTVLSLAIPAVTLGQANKRDLQVQNDRKQFTDDATWIYNDLAKGFAAAKATGKPMLVVFR